MNKVTAEKLKVIAPKIAEIFSNKDREHNYNHETFSVQEIIPTSDMTAVLKLKKNTGKLAVLFLYFLPTIKNEDGTRGKWYYFFPTDSHIAGFRAFELYKIIVEQHNYKYNFNEEEPTK